MERATFLMESLMHGESYLGWVDSRPFSDFPKKRKEKESKNRYLSDEIRFRVRLQILNPDFKI